jgi:hypothetical protein
MFHKRNFASKEEAMIKHLSIKVFLLVAAACAVVFFLGGNAIADSKNCAAPGAYFGDNPFGSSWIVNITRGSSATVGQVYLEWVHFDATLGGAFPSAVRFANAVGVWQKVEGNLYEWTWVSHGFDASGTVLYTLRASGTWWFVDCDHGEEAYVVEVFLPSQDMNTDPPVSCFPGTATETRMQVVQAVCE